MKKTKPPLSHREFKKRYVVEENPRIVALREQARVIAEKVKREGIS